MNKYSIGEISRETGLSIDTLRYYERIDLLVDIERNNSGHRCYTNENLSWLNLLTCLRETGMPIADMIHFAELVREGEETVGNRLELLELHRLNVLDKMAQMQKKLEVIDKKINFYSSEKKKQKIKI